MDKQLDYDLFGNVVQRDPLLRERFGEPPFSVLDAKGGNWQTRKRLWKALGLQSEVGRGAQLLGGGKGNNEEQDAALTDKYGRKITNGVGVFDNATSIFDPSLCELMYRWFAPEGGTILDPFAGGSVRGIVANYLGYKYTGIDVREEQVLSNREQAMEMLPANNQPVWLVGDSNKVLEAITNRPGKRRFYNAEEVTPTEQYPMGNGWVWVKREDLYMAPNGANGSKSRSAHHLIAKAKAEGYKGVTTAGSRLSPQINIVARIAKHYGMEFHAHAPNGELGVELVEARDNFGGVIHQHTAGYNSVIQARARQWSEEQQHALIPFGMVCREAVEQTEEQLFRTGLPNGVKRIVVCVGSGMNLAGLLWGLQKLGTHVPVLGVRVGADPTKVLNEYAPFDWRERCELVEAPEDYHTEVAGNVWNGITLDPIYEGKCLRFLEEGDMFWVIGCRNTLAPINVEEQATATPRVFDMVLSCPPYGNLEVYSDMEADISNKTHTEFLRLYGEIIAKTGKLLKRGGYAVFVVSEFRDKQGYYVNFVGDTITAFERAGLRYYNSAVLLQPLGSAMLRAARIFEASQKLCKVHEQVLVFKKP